LRGDIWPRVRAAGLSIALAGAEVHDAGRELAPSDELASMAARDPSAAHACGTGIVTAITGPEWVSSGTACVAEDGKPPVRKLVKARLLPDLHNRLTAYAEKTHRSLSSAAEHLIALAVDSEDRKTDS
jgi:hypothetical protein